MVPSKDGTTGRPPPTGNPCCARASRTVGKPCESPLAGTRSAIASDAGKLCEIVSLIDAPSHSDVLTACPGTLLGVN
jgi:hypothetical protein